MATGSLTQMFEEIAAGLKAGDEEIYAAVRTSLGVARVSVPTRAQELIVDRLQRDVLVMSVGATLLALGGMPDHVHLLIRLKADLSLANLVGALKSVSSKSSAALPTSCSGSTPMSTSRALSCGSPTVASAARNSGTRSDSGSFGGATSPAQTG